MSKVINSIDAINTYNTLKGCGYSFREIVAYILKSENKKGYELSENLCVVYFPRYAVVITPTEITRLKKV
ncbi:conserved hypothetical protein [Vibrio phage 193E37-1]|nr:conserved hypothetical protein [Vibrio phage 193E37-1]